MSHQSVIPGRRYRTTLQHCEGADVPIEATPLELVDEQRGWWRCRIDTPGFDGREFVQRADRLEAP